MLQLTRKLSILFFLSVLSRVIWADLSSEDSFRLKSTDISQGEFMGKPKNF